MVIHNTVIKQYSPIFYVMSAVITHHWCWDAMRETNPNGNLKTRQAKSLWHSETWHFQAFSSQPKNGGNHRDLQGSTDLGTNSRPEGPHCAGHILALIGLSLGKLHSICR